MHQELIVIPELSRKQKNRIRQLLSKIDTFY